MLMELFRESAVGQVVKYLSKDRLLRYPEEREDFHWTPLVSAICGIPEQTPFTKNLGPSAGP